MLSKKAIVQQRHHIQLFKVVNYFDLLSNICIQQQKTKMKLFKLIIAFIASSTESFSWIGLANIGKDQSSETLCDSTSLSFIQKRLCHMNSQFQPALNSAAKHSVKICSESMSYNLTKDVQKLPFMTSSLKKPTPESAYLHGLSSGQLITAVHKLCLTGAVDSQKCDMENVSNFVTEFTSIMSLVKRKKSVGQIEIHNSKIGRGLAWKSQKSLCKCHGTSGSCIAKTCWETAPLAEHLGKLAMEKYSNSIGIKVARASTGIPKEITNLLAKNDFLFIKN